MSRSLKKGPFTDPKLLAKVAKLKAGDRFVSRVAREPKLFVMGDAGEFAKLAEDRAA